MMMMMMPRVISGE